MRELTSEEKDHLNRRTERFDRFLSERMPVLADFAERLELPQKALIVADPKSFLTPIDEFMREQVVENDDRNWILVRLGYFIGEVLIQRYGGCWFLNDIPDTRFFLHYVVGRFTVAINRNIQIDPFLVADTYLNMPPGRSLFSILQEVETDIMQK